MVWVEKARLGVLFAGVAAENPHTRSLEAGLLPLVLQLTVQIQHLALGPRVSTFLNTLVGQLLGFRARQVGTTVLKMLVRTLLLDTFLQVVVVTMLKQQGVLLLEGTMVTLVVATATPLIPNLKASLAGLGAVAANGAPPKLDAIWFLGATLHIQVQQLAEGLSAMNPTGLSFAVTMALRQVPKASRPPLVRVPRQLTLLLRQVLLDFNPLKLVPPMIE